MQHIGNRPVLARRFLFSLLTIRIHFFRRRRLEQQAEFAERELLPDAGGVKQPVQPEAVPVRRV